MQQSVREELGEVTGCIKSDVDNSREWWEQAVGARSV